jgi:hypothetical protein
VSSKGAARLTSFVAFAGRLRAAVRVLERPGVGLLGTVGELSGLAAHQEPHRDDRDDSGAAEDPVEAPARKAA